MVAWIHTIWKCMFNTRFWGSLQDLGCGYQKGIELSSNRCFSSVLLQLSWNLVCCMVVLICKGFLMMTEVLQIYGYHQQTFHTISIDLSLQNLYFHLMVCLLFFVTWQNWSHEPVYSKTACHRLPFAALLMVMFGCSILHHWFLLVEKWMLLTPLTLALLMRRTPKA